MALIKLSTFLGQIPLVDATMLPDANSQVALDCWFVNGTLLPIRNSTTVGTPTNGASTKTLHRYRPCPNDSNQAYWFESASDLAVTPSPIANDKYGRLFYTWNDSSSPPSFGTVKTILGRANHTDLCGSSSAFGGYPVQNGYTLGVPSPGAAEAVVTSGWSSLATSSDGITWNGPQGNATVGKTLTVVQYLGGKWLAGGPQASIYYSTDGLSWTAAAIPQAVTDKGVTIKCIAYNGAYYVAGCSAGILMHSTDGQTWTLHSGTVTVTQDINAIVFIGNKWWMGGSQGRAFKSSTTDPSGAWVEATELQALFKSSLSINAGIVDYSGSRAYFGGAGGILASYAPGLAGASDHGGWTKVPSSKGYNGTADDTIVAMATASNTAVAIVSAHEIWRSWPNNSNSFQFDNTVVSGNSTLSSIFGSAQINGVAFGAGSQLILVGTNGSIAVESGYDTRNFAGPSTTANFGTNTINSVAFGGGLFVAVGTSDSATTSNRYYVITFVDGFGEQSAPGSPSGNLTTQDGQNVSLTWAKPDFTGKTVNTTGAYYYIYRTLSVGGSTEFLYVDKIAYDGAATATYSDIKPDSQLGEVLPSYDWIPPPADLKGIVSSPGGFLVGFTGNALWFSEPGQPHAWPTKYQRTVDYPIVGLGVFGNNILVATTGQPYILQGIDPFNMAVTKLESSHACMSRKSIVDLGDRVMYASNLGLVSVSLEGVEWVTRQMFTPDQWKLLNPASMRATSWEGRYLAFFEGSGDYIPLGAKALSVVPGSTEDGVSFYTQYGITPLRDPFDSTVYFLDQSGVFKSWNTASTYKTALWRSKLAQTPNFVNFGFLQIQPEEYPITVRLLSEEGDTAVFEATFTSFNHITQQAAYTVKQINTSGAVVQTWNGTCLNDTIRLPAGRRSRYHTIEVQTAVLCRAVLLAQSSAEVASA